MIVLLMPAQAGHSLRSQLRHQNRGQLAQCSLSLLQRSCLERPIQHSLLELGGTASPEAPGQQLGGKRAEIKCQANRAPKQQQETPRGITTNQRAVAVEGGYHGLGNAARIRNCLPSSGHAHAFDR